MKTLGDILKLSIHYLKEKNDSHARAHAEHLMSHVLKMPRLDLYLQFDRPLQDEELSSYRSLLKRKAQGEPLEYILGEMPFYDCILNITPSVLIPRPETEILIDKVCSRLKDKNLVGLHAWDLCCGSGCLGLSLKKKFPDLFVTLSDLSLEALSVAQKNSERNGLEVDFLQGDLLAPFKGRLADLVLCNPPYISQKDFNDLDPSVRLFEPKLALLGGESGHLFYERLACELPLFLNSGALVCFEIGYGQGEVVSSLFSASHWRAKSLEKDWAGHDRFFFLEFQ
ncbi:MAG: peptide chain release factor N(5)-glutamine methyltransferase [Rhabdochlamydiaceae bacterium]|nr:peptide chain release factor N(5)-glutamine methyltransferase [Rhabdochlamydiaceae bacterium]